MFKLSLYLFVGTLPLSRAMNTIFLWPMVLSWIFVSDFKSKLYILKSNKTSFLVIISIHLLYWIGLLTSENRRETFSFIEHSLALIIIPLIILSTQKYLFNLKKIIISLGVGIAITMIISWSYILIDILFAPNPLEQSKYIFQWLYTDWNLFKYVDIHPTYFSLMLVLLASSLIIDDSFSSFRSNKVNFVLTIFMLTIFLLEANSRVSLIAFVAILTLIGIKQFSGKQRVYLLFGITMILLIGSQFTYLSSKFSKIFDSNGNLNFERLLRWKEIIKVFLSKNQLLFGIGAGDTKEIFNQAYINGNFKLAFSKGYNAHNQYLEFFVSNGILGIIVYLFSIVYFAIKTRLKSIAFIFFTIIILFSTTESFLNRSKGVFFFATFYSLLIVVYQKTTDVKTE